jgi:PhoPQ-activated pathogenicity-related protein
MKLLFRCRLLLFLFLLLPLTTAAQVANHPNALDTYVHAADAHYQYTLVDSMPRSGYTVFLIRMISQQWRSSTEVNQPIWKHWMQLYIPDHLTSSIGMLYIRGGATDERPEQDEAAARRNVLPMRLKPA